MDSGSPVNRLQLTDILGVVLLVGLAWTPERMIGDPGLGWHLRAGQQMIATRGLLPFDPFLSPTPSAPWIHDQWLSDVILAAVWSIGGWSLLVVFCAFICVLPFVSVLLRGLTGAPAIAVLVSVMACALTASIQWFVRPVIFSFLLFAVVHRVCGRWWSDEKRELGSLALLPPLFILWVNLHGAFPLGLGVVAVYLLTALVTRRIAPRTAVLIGGGCLAAVLVNPWGINLPINVIRLAGSPYFSRLNVEWLSPDPFDRAFLPFFALGALLIVAGERAGLAIPERILLAVLFALGLISRRYIPFFGVAAIGPVCAIVSSFLLAWSGGDGVSAGASSTSPIRRVLAIPFRERTPLLTPAAAVLLAVFGISRGHLPSERRDWLANRYPVRAAEWLEAHGPAPLFHSPDAGGYLTWALYPGWRAFIDDRNQLLGVDRYEEYFTLALARPGWEEVASRHGFRYFLLAKADPLAAVLEHDPRFRTVFADTASGVEIIERSSDGSTPALSSP